MYYILSLLGILMAAKCVFCSVLLLMINGGTNAFADLFTVAKDLMACCGTLSHYKLLHEEACGT